MQAMPQSVWGLREELMATASSAGTVSSYSSGMDTISHGWIRRQRGNTPLQKIAVDFMIKF